MAWITRSGIRPPTATWQRTTRRRILTAKAPAAPICCTHLAWRMLRKRRRSSASSRGLPRKRDLTSWRRSPKSSPTRDVVVVALGTGDPYYENLFREWAFRHPGKWLCRFATTRRCAHKIEAGADMFLMPSRYEPCGLNQMYSLKYGTVPIVRATGGLDDTIEEWDAKKGTGTGFKFAGYGPKDLLAEIDRALEAFQRQKRLDAVDA